MANKRLEKANFLTLKNNQSKSSLVPPNDKKFLVFFWDQRVKIRRNRKGRKPGRDLCVRLEVKITCCAITLYTCDKDPKSRERRTWRTFLLAIWTIWDVVDDEQGFFFQFCDVHSWGIYHLESDLAQFDHMY